ncbi:NADPH-dependent F420 reductase [Leifsonia poae]|uniref:NADPH-dependent F420 reductase n=1 Tax=Leifsonia poae TaxID=110933 RepID=UPI001CC0DF41|nr:NAD(P)-binding domain-containing protein [Leifsonia poae]
MTSALGSRLVRAGHEVVIGSRDPDRAQRRSETIGASGATDYRSAAGAEAVILALHDTSALEIVASLADALAGSILIDITNPLDAPGFESRYAGGASLAERIAAVVPTATVVKAFNSVYAEWLAEDRVDPVQVLIASDDAPAKAVVAALIEQIGCEPVDVGPLRVARHLENLAGFEVDLVDRGFAPFVAFRLQTP